MANKPAKIYRIPKKRSYTRKEYMDGIPASKITIFDMGDLQNADKFQVELSLVSKEFAQITHNALEAARVAANKYLMDKTGKGYYLKCRLYPHEVLRENKQATGAGADRVSEGMRRAFGKAVALGAKAQKGQKIMTAAVNLLYFTAAKESLKRAAAKLPMHSYISIDKGKELLR